MDLENKNKIVKIVEYILRRMYAHNLKADIGSTGEVFDETIENAQYEECKEILNFIDSMEGKPTSVWHNANEEPIKGRIILVMTSVCNIADKNISFMGEYIGNGYIQAFNAKEYINSWAKWAYRDELIKLQKLWKK